MADIAIIAKVDSAADAHVQRFSDKVKKVNPQEMIIRAASPIQLDDLETVRDRLLF